MTDQQWHPFGLRSLLRRTGAELLGTCALVTVGCGAIIVNTLTGALGQVGIGLAFGLIIAVMIAALGHLSGAHFNPAVTVAFALVGRFPWPEVPIYISGQIVGATLGALTLRWLFGPVANLGATLPQGNPLQALGIEILLTTVLTFVITSVTADTRTASQPAALVIGATVARNALWAGPITGASMNPARSFGPAVVAGIWQAQWIYWLGPLVGAGMGASIYQLLHQSSVKQGS